MLTHAERYIETENVNQKEARAFQVNGRTQSTESQIPNIRPKLSRRTRAGIRLHTRTHPRTNTHSHTHAHTHTHTLMHTCTPHPSPRTTKSTRCTSLSSSLGRCSQKSESLGRRCLPTQTSVTCAASNASWPMMYSSLLPMAVASFKGEGGGSRGGKGESEGMGARRGDGVSAGVYARMVESCNPA